MNARKGNKRIAAGWVIIAIGLLTAVVWTASPEAWVRQARHVLGLSFSHDTHLLAWPVVLGLCCVGLIVLNSGLFAAGRLSASVCVQCGYPLVGLPKGAPCPECGKGTGG